MTYRPSYWGLDVLLSNWGLMQLLTRVYYQCQIPDRLWQHVRVLFVCFLFLNLSDTEIQPFNPQNNFQRRGVKGAKNALQWRLLCKVFWPFSCYFYSSIGKESKSSCFFTWNYLNFKWISYWTVPNGKKGIIPSTFANEAVTCLSWSLRRALVSGA